MTDNLDLETKEKSYQNEYICEIEKALSLTSTILRLWTTLIFVFVLFFNYTLNLANDLDHATK